MAQRGRKSAASLSVVTQDTPIGAQRLVAPVTMSQAECEVWAQVVNDHPADCFTDTHIPILELYCRHIIRGSILQEKILAFNPDWLDEDDGLKRYDKLLGMAEREGRAASSLATRLRITRQAIDQQTVARAQQRGGKKKRPWDKK